MKYTVAALLGLVASKKSEVNKDKCLALSMSGGGSLGSYEAGGIWGMYFESEDKTKFEYDILTGVSAGAINTVAMAVFEQGDEDAMIRDVSKRWEYLTQDELEVRWKPLGVVTGIKKESGVFNTAPLGKYIADFLAEHDNTFQRKFVVSAVDVNSGSYRLYDETYDDPVKAVLSSSAIPFVFPNQKHPDGAVDMDGGTVFGLNLVSAVQRCREIVDDDSKITIDIIVCHDVKEMPPWENRDSAVSNFLYFDTIKQVYKSSADIYEF